MYNFEVADYQTFAVTDDAVWVHNCGGNYRKRYDDAKGAPPAGSQRHHSYPQEHRDIANAANYDIDDPSRVFSVPSKPGKNRNVHNAITQEWRKWRNKVGQPTHKQILQKKKQMDKKYRKYYDQ